MEIRLKGRKASPRRTTIPMERAWKTIAKVRASALGTPKRLKPRMQK
jgi:hypothetical protein